ncbi:MAG: ribokinase [Anaerolineaceae bacterium]|nr:ribokinase [Anaerolineaceae bacterium]
MAKILVVGSINMDLVVRVPHSPKPGETVLGGDFETFPGGKGANQAVAAARMDGEVTMVGRVGIDAFGDSLIQGLLDNQIKTTHVIKDPDTSTGVAMIAVSADGENMIVVASGANYKVSPEDVNDARDLMRETDLLLVQLECPLEAVAAAIELANAYGVPVVLNPAPAQQLSRTLLANVDVLTPNENELLLLSGESTIEKAILKLRSWGVKSLVITLGANGVRVVTEDMDRHLPAYEVTAVDTTAAGDAFNGAMAVILAEGKDLLDAVQYGLAAGALAATKRGAQPSLPTRDAVDKFVQINRR